MKTSLTLIAALLLSTSAIAQTETVLFHSSDAKIVAKTSIIVHAVCPRVVYDLEIDRQDKRVNFSVTTSESAISTMWDMSSSDFGKEIVARRLCGKYGIVCGRNRAVIYFQGLEVLAESKVVPVSYSVHLMDDGTSDFLGGVHQERPEYVDYMLYK